MKALTRNGYDMLIKEPAFKRVQVPHKAQELSDRFKAALLDPYPNLEDQEEFTTTADNMSGIFQDVLELKAQALTGDIVYSLLTIKPDTPFDPAIMRVHSIRPLDLELDDATAQAQQTSKSVKLCLFPALFRTPASYVEPQRDLHDSASLIRLRNFESIGMDDKHGLYMLSKALVVVN